MICLSLLSIILTIIIHSSFSLLVPTSPETLNPFAYRQASNSLQYMNIQPLVPMYRSNYFFTTPVTLGPFLMPPSNLGPRYFLLSFSLLIAQSLNATRVDSDLYDANSRAQCRYDAFVTQANNPSGYFWWEPLQQLLSDDPEIIELFLENVISRSCLAYSGANILMAKIPAKGSQNGSMNADDTFDFYYTHAIILNMPVNQTNANNSTIASTSFMMSTAQSLAWYPITMQWFNIPNSWFTAILNKPPALQSTHLLHTAWCGSSGYILLLQLDGKPVLTTPVNDDATFSRIFVIELQYQYERESQAELLWTATPVNSTSKTILDPAFVEDLYLDWAPLHPATITFCYASNFSPNSSNLYYLNPSTFNLWMLDTHTGWRAVKSNFPDLVSQINPDSKLLPPPVIFKQSATEPPLICWSQITCILLSFNSSRQFMLAAQRAFQFTSSLAYMYAWISPNYPLDAYFLDEAGELVISFDYQSVNSTLSWNFPRLGATDPLGLMMMDGTSAAEWITGVSAGKPFSEVSVVGFEGCVFTYACSVVLPANLIPQECPAQHRIMIQFDYTFQTMNVLTVLVEPGTDSKGSLPPYIWNTFHSTIKLSLSLLAFYSLNSIRVDVGNKGQASNTSCACLIYSVAFANDGNVSVQIPSNNVNIWVYCPLFRRFFAIGYFPMTRRIIPKLVDVDFTSGIQSNQIFCALTVTTFPLGSSHYVYENQLYMGNVTSSGIVWQELFLLKNAGLLQIKSPSIIDMIRQRELLAIEMVDILFTVFSKEAVVQMYLAQPPAPLGVTVTNVTLSCKLLTSICECHDQSQSDCGMQCTSREYDLLIYSTDQIVLVPLSNGIVIIFANHTSVNSRVSAVQLYDVFSGRTQEISVDSAIGNLWGSAGFLPMANAIVMTNPMPSLNFRRSSALTLQCPPRTFNVDRSSSPASKLCDLCTLGTWSDTVGATACVLCDYPLTTASVGPTNSLMCNVCPSSYCHENGDCLLSSAGGAGCQCNFGYYASDRCRAPWLFIATMLIASTTLIILISLRRYRAIKTQQRQQQDKLQSEIADLKHAWEIEWSSLTNMKLLASGGFGAVYSANWCGRKVAVKVMHDAETSALSPDFEREARALRRYRHPQIVLFFGVGRNEDEHQFLVTEFVDRGSLRDVLEDESLFDTLTWSVRLNMAVDVASGLEFLHRQAPPVIHRDLKSPNVLVTSGLRCKIGDLGTARLISIAQTNQDQHASAKYTGLLSAFRRRRAQSTLTLFQDALETHVQLLASDAQMMMSKRVGTTKWAAPEMLRGDTNYGLPVDIYACGIVFWEIVTNELPFSDVLWSWEVAEEVSKGKRPQWPANHFAENSGDYMTLTEACWAALPDQRPTASRIVEQLSVIT